jgi:glycosyltransferase involved in cell wall biosynthesis
MGAGGAQAMISTVAAVIRGEGLVSALRRTEERIAEGVRSAALSARAPFVRSGPAAILNVSAASIAARLGGVQAQLVARLEVERTMRSVALLHPGGLELSAPVAHLRAVEGDFETRVRRALELTGATTVHLEGSESTPLDSVLRLAESGIRLVVSIHDFSLVRDQGRRLLLAATGLVFPSRFLLERYRELFSLPLLAGEIVEPGVRTTRPVVYDGRAIAYAGSVKPHKGGRLLPDLVPPSGLHIFGGGDEDLLRAVRRVPNVTIHGYYRQGRLPSLLARHRAGLVVLPSIVPESYGLVMSEAWLAGAAVVAFDHGALAERIREHGGGWLAPLESGAAGLMEIMREWSAGRISTDVPHRVSSAADAARAYVALYQRWG